MVFPTFTPNIEFIFALNLLLSIVLGYLIGFERESKGKSAGISTQCLVIGGSMIFSFLSYYFDPNSPARVAAQIVTGVGFLGAGIILQRNDNKIINLTTAATLWFAAGIGMAIGLGFYLLAILATLFAVIVLRIPHINISRIKIKKRK